MVILLCENNLAGFLTAVYKYYYGSDEAEKITSLREQITMLDSYSEISADEELARKVRAGIIKKCGAEGYAAVAAAYLNSHPDKEQYIFEYLKLLFKHGKSVLSMFGDDAVIRFNDLKRKVLGETHLLSGFVRLQETESGVFYGYFKSDHDIIELLMKNMRHRYNSQKFALHDISRQKMIYYDGAECHYTETPRELEIALSESEIAFQKLWKLYFDTVAIEGRKNLKLQRSFLPKRYRLFMHEF